MSLARTEYLRGLVEDPEIVSRARQLVLAIALNNAADGLFRALLDLTDTDRLIAGEISAITRAA